MQEINVTGNLFENNTSDGVAIQGLQNVKGPSGSYTIDITNNTLAFNRLNGLLIYQNANRLLVTGNLIFDNSMDLSSFSDGIAIVASNVVYVQILENTIFDDQKAPTQDYGIRAFHNGILNNLVVFNNDFSGNRRGAFSDDCLIPSLTCSIYLFPLRGLNFPSELAFSANEMQQVMQLSVLYRSRV